MSNQVPFAVFGKIQRQTGNLIAGPHGPPVAFKGHSHQFAAIRLFCLCFLFFFPDLPQPSDVRSLHHWVAHRHGHEGLVAFLRIGGHAQEEIRPPAHVARRCTSQNARQADGQSKAKNDALHVLGSSGHCRAPLWHRVSHVTDSRSVIVTEPESVNKKKPPCDSWQRAVGVLSRGDGIRTRSENVPQMDRPTFDEFLKLDRHLSAFVSVRNRKKRTAAMRYDSMSSAPVNGCRFSVCPR